MPLNKKYFIDLFTAVPDELWCMGRFRTNPGTTGVGARCAAGIAIDTGSFDTLIELLEKHYGKPFSISRVNDGEHHKFQQLTPKLRVLAALNELPD